MEESDKKPFTPEWYTANPYTFKLLKESQQAKRTNLTTAEEILWEYLKDKKMGVKIRSHHLIDNYAPDFVALSCKLIIEVDGEIHKYKKEEDEKRASELTKKGFKVIRFTNDDIFNDILTILKKIKTEIENRKRASVPS
jgi:very-short-patch-repair endonuclease